MGHAKVTTTLAIYTPPVRRDCSPTTTPTRWRRLGRWEIHGLQERRTPVASVKIVKLKMVATGGLLRRLLRELLMKGAQRCVLSR